MFKTNNVLLLFVTIKIDDEWLGDLPGQIVNHLSSKKINLY